jgi:membrane protein YqaA with SNARE-associated domain
MEPLHRHGGSAVTFVPLHWAATVLICGNILALAFGYYLGRKCRACEQRKRQAAREEYEDVLPISGKVSEPVTNVRVNAGESVEVNTRDVGRYIRIVSTITPSPSPVEFVNPPPTTDRLTDY